MVGGVVNIVTNNVRHRKLRLEPIVGSVTPVSQAGQAESTAVEPVTSTTSFALPSSVTPAPFLSLEL